MDGTISAEQLTMVARAVLSGWESATDTVYEPSPQALALSRLVESAEVFSPGDSRPSAGDTATIAITLSPGRPSRAEVVGVDVPSDFQLRAWRAANGVDEGLRSAVVMGAAPLALGPSVDSTIVVLRFGAEPLAGDGFARFAAQWRALSVSRAIRVEYPDVARQADVEAKVRLAFIVAADGRVDTSMARVVEAPYREFIDAAKAGLARARFHPEMRDCRAMSRVVEQEFNFRLLR
jgi:TonB family protein